MVRPPFLFYPRGSAEAVVHVYDFLTHRTIFTCRVMHVLLHCVFLLVSLRASLLNIRPTVSGENVL